MKSLIISNSDVGGGAAIAGYRLHEGLRRIGQASGMLVREKLSSDADVHLWAKERDESQRWLDKLTDDLRLKARTPLSTTYFSLPWPGEDVCGHDLVSEAEVINLHWVGHFVSPEGLRSLLQTGKPVIWTLHDERAFTGGCHYSSGCGQFLRDCSGCPQLREPFQPVAEQALELSRACLKGVPAPTIVAPSQWLAAEARRSSLFSGCRVECIPYGLDLELFKATDKKAARARFGLPEEALVILFGAQSLAEPRKGFDLVRRAIEMALDDADTARAVAEGRVIFAAYGQSGEKLRETRLPLVLLGEQTTEKEMAGVLSASDLFICPSREDNLPNTVMEAMSCGVPVLGAQVGGIPDMVDHGVNGCLVPPNDAEELGRALLNLIRKPLQWSAWGAEARRKCESVYDIEQQARAYAALHEELLTVGSRVSRSEPETVVADARKRLLSTCLSAMERLSAETKAAEMEVRKQQQAAVTVPLKEQLKAVESELQKARGNPFRFLLPSYRRLKRQKQQLRLEIAAQKKINSDLKSKKEERKDEVAAPTAILSSSGSRVSEATMIVTAAEINDRHGTGVLLARLFGREPLVIHVRSMNLYGGQTMGDLQICLPPGAAASTDFASLLQGSSVSRMLSVPYDGSDVKNTLALHALTGAPLVVWLMDHNLGDGPHQIPRAEMRRLLDAARLVLGISPEFCSLYQAEFGVPVHFAPPVVEAELGQRRLLHLPPEAFQPATGVLLGNIWSQRWLAKLADCVASAKLPLTAFGHKSPQWVKHQALESCVQFRGFLPETELVSELRRHPFAVVPTGTMDGDDDLPEIARYSLPSRTLYLSAVGNLPIIVTGNAESGVAKFVQRHDLGVVVPYEGRALRQTSEWICRPEQQLRYRRSAAALAPAFACDDATDWLWRSLQLGRPCDDRWSEAAFSKAKS